MNYTNFTFSELITKISNARFWDLPKMLAEALRKIQQPKYKVYTALLTQTGTNAPVATVLENTLGGEVVWSYVSIGNYLATLSGAFTENKTLLPNVYSLSVDGVLEGTIKYNRIGISSIQLDARQDIDGDPSDDLLNAGGDYFVEIRVYN